MLSLNSDIIVSQLHCSSLSNVLPEVCNEAERKNNKNFSIIVVFISSTCAASVQREDPYDVLHKNKVSLMLNQ
jgi:hypothetical protein